MLRPADLLPVTLEGQHVRLEPLSLEHRAPLAKIALDPDLWQWTLTRIYSLEDLDAFIETALSWQRAGTAIPFATLDRATGRVIGTTRFANIDRENCSLEIGWTWLGREFHRRAFNTEAKLLMLAHAFERIGCIRVEFRVNVLNHRSRTAVLRLGAREEGVMRHKTIAVDGRLIDWVYYSILAEEWPAVKVGLEQKLSSHAPA
jgi:N-acetyltransferase